VSRFWISGGGSRRGSTGRQARGNAVLGGVYSLGRPFLTAPREVANVRTSIWVRRRGARALGPGEGGGKQRGVGMVDGGRGLQGWRFGCCRGRS